MASVSFKNIQKTYGGKVKVIHGIGFDIADGEFVVLVGPSGCGKSTLLRMLAGLEEITGGQILIDDKVVNDLESKDRDIAMVFQSYALYPHMSVRENIAFPLTLAKLDKATITQKVEEAARILDLTSYLDRKPANLSGGQRQRVAMGRAIVRSPKAFLMDEPLSNLDAKLRVQMRTEISQLQRRLGTTTVYVTHDQTEAMTLGDRVVVLRGGYVQQIGSPQELYNNPVNLFVAGFIGSPAMNFIPGTLAGEAIDTSVGRITLPDHSRIVANAKGGGEVLIGIRPENLEDAALIDPQTREAGGTFTADIGVLESMGSDKYAYFDLDHGGSVHADAASVGAGQFVARLSPESQATRGSRTELFFDTRKVAVFDQSSGANLRL